MSWSSFNLSGPGLQKSRPRRGNQVQNPVSPILSTCSIQKKRYLLGGSYLFVRFANRLMRGFHDHFASTSKQPWANRLRGFHIQSTSLSQQPCANLLRAHTPLAAWATEELPIQKVTKAPPKEITGLLKEKLQKASTGETSLEQRSVPCFCIFVVVVNVARKLPRQSSLADLADSYQSSNTGAVELKILFKSPKIF